MVTATALAQPQPEAAPPVVTEEVRNAVPDPKPVPKDNRIFGVLPNYRTAQDGVEYHPITPKQKFTIAIRDSFDWPGYFVSAAFAGIYQLENSNPAFGQGVKGYAHRLGTSYADQVIGNVLTEGLLPTVLHEDPRYFRKANGSIKGRTGYAITRIFITRKDSGNNGFNFSELIGNSSAAAISNFYYPESRTVSENSQKLALQLATDAISNVMKEFWPDVKRKYFNKH
jgi:hypothetical protein